MGIFKRFIDKVTGQKSANDEDWDELTQELVQSDLGRELSESIVNAARKSKLDPIESLTNELSATLSKKSRVTNSGVILIVGVNGTGKTTSAAKLAKHLSGNTLLAAADTFRAAAVDQLRTWGQKKIGRAHV